MKFWKNNIMNNTRGEDYLHILQIFRGFAALMVVVCHLILSFRHFYNWDNQVLIFIGNFGSLGVDFFFVLSGFIISYSTSQKKYKFKNYLTNRILRIYMPYLPIGIAMFLLYFLFPNISESSRDVNLIRSITLFPIGSPALSVAWTLSYEMMFYLLFGLSFISKKLWNIFLIIWASSIIFFNYIFILTLNNIIFLKPYCLEFLLGYFTWFLYFNKIRLKKYILWLCVIIFFSLTFIIKYHDINLFNYSYNLTFSIFVSFLILSVINQSLPYKLSKNKILLLVGNASYSIYLVHDPIISLLVRLIHSNRTIVLFCIFFVICCICGILYYFIFEKYVLNKTKKFVSTKFLINTK